MKHVVTGAAGFIGSHLCERLLAQGGIVLGIDGFTDYYSREWKERNLAGLREEPGFKLLEADLGELDWGGLLEEDDIVYHLAGQPGVRPSWGAQFERYLHDNIWVTQHLLEALKEQPVKRLVFASSSSVYGDAEMLPTKESALPRPVSPYGVSKLAAEHLVHLYGRNFQVPAVAVRYFTVYGPRQRPDMALTKFMRAVWEGRPIEVYGDGEQTREFTFVSDAVEGTLAAASADCVGLSINLGGGSRVSVNRVLELLEEISGMHVARKHVPDQAGDPRHTGASITLAREKLGWEPKVGLKEGLKAQWKWFTGEAEAKARAGARVVPATYPTA